MKVYLFFDEEDCECDSSEVEEVLKRLVKKKVKKVLFGIESLIKNNKMLKRVVIKDGLKFKSILSKVDGVFDKLIFILLVVDLKKIIIFMKKFKKGFISKMLIFFKY